MRVQSKFEVPQAFVVKIEDLTKLWQCFEKSIGPPAATAQCADGLVRHFESLSELTGFENAERTKINSLELSARSREYRERAEVALGGKFLATISVTMEGEEDTISKLMLEVKDILYGMRPWYSRIARLDMFYVWFPIFLVVFLLLQIMAQGAPQPQPIPFSKALGVTGFVLVLIFVIGGIVWGSAKLRNRFFPLATFAIGQGLGRHQHQEQIRWVVIVGFLVGVAASILATVMLAA